MSAYRNQYIDINKWTRPGIKNNGVKKLAVHYTANPGAPAANHYRYFGQTLPAQNRNLSEKKQTFASAHIFVDRTEAICIIPLNEVAYHANDILQFVNGQPYRGVAALKPNANFLSIGVELCIEKDGTFHPDTIARAEQVCAELCKMYKLNPINDIVRHYDITHKICPAPWVNNSQGFADFKARVKKRMAGAVVTVPVVSNPDVTHTDTGRFIKNTVVSSDGLVLRTKRSASSSMVLNLPNGTVVKYQIGSTVNGWGYVEYTNSKGQTFHGYVNVSYIKSDNELKSGSKKKVTTSKLKTAKKSKISLPAGIFKVTNPLTRGESVKQIQTALASLHYYPDKNAKNFGIDGAYGPKTENAVKRFQSMYGLPQDGIYGPDTKAKIEALLK
ncbi:peptidoglycan-binding protein [Bacillus sp. L381]|uniref:N-acetylmuramoyl-L-alanine amidase n=1 Tax=Bacillus TaxID=1386 RepID=UPI001BAAD6B5|nr:MULTISPECIES: N-acetylmuramoyl-L-alanine amidase [Bacillus]MCR9038526.1 peptidoglycan-binding protein [Bacillus velezensis]QUN07879.1 N-acetylmuramoyl-L-alanine amidase [Bacillus amyloliquefaciens]QYM83488.1 peptidoglycan-binding protein [Bacillus sp. 7D3]QZY10090.1 peptidoglycan-binding protein [Bacillus amyloliquefaciens]WIX19990.1 peptidoglycan-binding protein [Bacillus sp. L381]